MFSQASVILSTGGSCVGNGRSVHGEAWQGGVCGQEACMVEGMHGRGCAWHRVCMAGDICGGVVCGSGGICGREHAWHGGVHGIGCAF